MGGYAVDWVRRCYRSNWRLHESDPSLLTPGKYIWAPKDTPFYPDWHLFGASVWTSDERNEDTDLGEVPYVGYPPWSNGVGPEIFPLPKAVGSADCIANGEKNLPLWRRTLTNTFKNLYEYTFLDSYTFAGYHATLERSDGFPAGGFFSATVRFVANGPLGWTHVIIYQIPTVDVESTTVSFLLNTFSLVPLSDSSTDVGGGYTRITRTYHIPTSLLGVFTFQLGFLSSGSDVPGVRSVAWLWTSDPPFYPPDLWNGFPVECFPGSVIAVALPDISGRDSQRLLARVLSLQYLDQNAANVLAQEILPDGEIAFLPNSDSFFPGTVIAKNANGTILWVSGTSTFQQAALEATSALTGPINFGTFGTSVFWWNAANVLLDRLIAFSVDLTKPFVLVGHSYGGVLAAILAARITIPEISLLTFGMPIPGDDRLAAIIGGKRSLHFANRGDPLPSLPPQQLTLAYVNNFLPVGLPNAWQQWLRTQRQVILESDGSTIDSQEDSYSLTELIALVALIVAGITPAALPAHSMQTYLSRILL